jgi:hypothetical protein
MYDLLIEPERPRTHFTVMWKPGLPCVPICGGLKITILSSCGSTTIKGYLKITITGNFA